jgi:hypothetical protein
VLQVTCHRRESDFDPCTVQTAHQQTRMSEDTVPNCREGMLGELSRPHSTCGIASNEALKDHPERIVNPQRLGARSGAAFGATLYLDFVLLCATRCDVDNEFKSFILLSLFGYVRYGAGKCFRRQERT